VDSSRRFLGVIVGSVRVNPLVETVFEFLKPFFVFIESTLLFEIDTEQRGQ